MGAASWSLATPADVEAIAADRLRSALAERLSIRGGPLSLDQLRRIEAVCAESQSGGGGT